MVMARLQGLSLHQLTCPKRSDKMHLWDVQIDDELVSNAKAKISEILSENLEVIKLALYVYDDYFFILKEIERIKTFLKKEPFDIEEFQAEIDIASKTPRWQREVY